MWNASDNVCELRRGLEFASFASSVGRKKIFVDNGSESWEVLEVGRRNGETVVFLGPLMGNANEFFHQLLAETGSQRRFLSVKPPPFWSTDEFSIGFHRFLRRVGIKKAHIVGASLGGFLAQKFAERYPEQVASLLLCNSFVNTAIFRRDRIANLFWFLPSEILKGIVLSGLPGGVLTAEIRRSMDFMVESLESLPQSLIASRLHLNCQSNEVETRRLMEIPMTIMDVNDVAALSHKARDLTSASYPLAKRATMKTGGNFPYLSNPQEFNLILNIHLKSFSILSHDN